MAEKSWGSHHREGEAGKRPHFLCSIWGKFFPRFQDRIPDSQDCSAREELGPRDGREGPGALTGAEVTPAGALVMSRIRGGGPAPGLAPAPGPALGLPLPSHGPEGTRSVKPAGSSSLLILEVTDDRLCLYIIYFCTLCIVKLSSTWLNKKMLGQ